MIPCFVPGGIEMTPGALKAGRLALAFLVHVESVRRPRQLLQPLRG